MAGVQGIPSGSDRGPALRIGWRLPLGVILAVALLLRTWGLTTGLPYAVGTDEPEIMTKVVRMMKTGDFNPHFFDWPSLTIYLQLQVAVVAFLAGAMRGAWNNLSQVGAPDFYVYGRMTTALIGTGTVAVLFAAARRWSLETALVAAALLAVQSNHVRESHYVLTDVPTAFLVTLALLMSLRALERPSPWTFALAGLTVGLAASSKYNGSMAIVLPLIAACAAGGAPAAVLQRLFIVSASAATGFLIGTPYAVLDLPKFLNDYARLAAKFAKPRGGEPGWSIYLKYLAQSYTVIGLLMAAIGLACSGIAVIRRPSRARGLMLVSFPLIYFAVMARSYQIYGRYTLPLQPFVALLAAIGGLAIVDAVGERLTARFRAPAVAALALLLVAFPAAQSIQSDRAMTRISTTDLAYRWIDSHLPTGAVIVSETAPTMLVSTRYHITMVHPLSGKTFEQYANDGVDYVLVSASGYVPAINAPDSHESAYLAYMSLFRQGRELATFQESDDTPGPELKLLQIRGLP